MAHIWFLATPYFHALVLIFMGAIWYDLRRTINNKLAAKERTEKSARIGSLQEDNPFV
jgi:hypothetical protein